MFGSYSAAIQESSFIRVMNQVMNLFAGPVWKLPGISAEDCLFAELGIVPSKNGQV